MTAAGVTGAARVGALAWSSIPSRTRELLAPLGARGQLAIFRTLARHPRLLERWFPFGQYVAMQSTLAPRERELAILRVGCLCNSPYEIAAHLPIARAAGISEADWSAIQCGPDAPGASAADRLLLRAVDELCRSASLRDDTWAALAQRYGVQELLDLIAVVGEYQLVSMLANALRLPLQDELTLLAADAPR